MFRSSTRDFRFELNPNGNRNETHLASSGTAEHWLRRGLQLTVIMGIVAAALSPARGSAQDKVLNLYSARHYQTDDALYDNFTKQTGIKINRIELGDEQLLQRLKTEGANSPADVVLLVDAARLWRAQIDGLFQPVQSKVLDERIPANFRSNDGTWFGFSMRARCHRLRQGEAEAGRCRHLREACRSEAQGSGLHTLRLASVHAVADRRDDRANGEARTEEWARGMVANMARPPRGGDTDQIKGVAAGECGVALTNSYYWLRLVASERSEGQGGRRRRWASCGRTRRRLARTSTFRAAAWRSTHRTGERGPVPGIPVEPAGADLLCRRQQRVAGGEGRKARTTRRSRHSAHRSSKNVPVSTIGKNQIAAQRILDRVGYR